MELLRFKAKHFRCLYDIDWIAFHKPTVLIGCNDGGKTATIEALEYFFSGTPPDTEAYSYKPDTQTDADGNRLRESDIVLEAEFKLNPQEVTLLGKILLTPPTEYIHLRRIFRHSDEDSPPSFEMLTSVPENPDLPTSPATLRINEIRELLKQHKIPNPGGTVIEPLRTALIQWLQQQTMKNDWTDVPTEVYDCLPTFQLVKGPDPEETIFQLLSSTHKQLLKQPEIQGLLKRFEDEVDKQFREPLEEKTSNLTKYINNYLPEIKNAYVIPKFGISASLREAPLTLVGEDGNKINLSSRGAGTKQKVTLAVYEWDSDTKANDEGSESDSILAFDEPDLHLDYQAQRRIYEAIEAYIKKGIQVLVATHSMNLINRVPVEYIYHYAKPPGISNTTIECLQPSKDDPEETAFFIDRMGEAMGLDNASIFYERCFLAFEGQTEQTALPILFYLYTKDTLTRTGIKLVNCYNAHGAITFAKFIHRNRRPVLFMVDTDTTINKGTKRMLTEAALEKAKFSIKEQVHLIGPECFEYAFSDEVWARVLNRNQPNSQNDWTTQKIQAYRTGSKKFIEETQAILQEESKPKIGIMLAKAIEEKEEIPECIRNCFDAAIKMANK